MHASFFVSPCKLPAFIMPWPVFAGNLLCIALQRQDLSRTYLAHHELESNFITGIIIYYYHYLLVMQPCCDLI